MSYIKAMDVLPKELIDKVQKYIDGEYIYIPRKAGNKKAWGEKTKSRGEIALRNMEIFKKNKAGISVISLAEIYYLSPKSIQKIIAGIKQKIY
jgi:Mor family transcriptional regulator